MRRLFAVALSLILMISSRAAEPRAASSQPLGDPEINAALDQIFAQQKQLTRLQAKVISRKSGGVFSGDSAATWGEAYAQLPDLLLFVDHGESGKDANSPAYVLIDGSHLWDMKPAGDGNYEAERIDLKNAGDRDLNIASLLIGAAVSNSAELREYYQVLGAKETFADGGQSYHFTFVTLPGKSKTDKDETSELWIRIGEIIPWYLRVTAKVKKTDVFTGETSYKDSRSEKEFSDVKTNFSKPPLAPFNVVDTFYIGKLLLKHRGAKVFDKGNLIPNAQLTSDLKILLSRLQEKQQR